MIALRRYFLDTEFFQTPELDSRLISLGVIAEDDAGTGLYEISSAFNEQAAAHTPWIKTHVLDRLDPAKVRITPAEIADRVVDYIQPAKRIEFWASQGSYDFYQLCQVFACAGAPSAMHVMRTRLATKGVERIAFREYNELKKLAGDPSGLPKIPDALAHVCINDARWDRDEFPVMVARAIARQPIATKAFLA